MKRHPSLLVTHKFDCHQHKNDKKCHVCEKQKPKGANIKRKARVPGLHPVETHTTGERGGT